jgi:DNA (cytosine-5)-methyltransferase 1
VRAAVFFSGAAGTSVGAQQAGAEIVFAANHSPVCVAVHAANFPMAENRCQDLHLFNHAAMPDHDILLASPVCRASSNASQPARAAAKKKLAESSHGDRAKGAAMASAHNAMRALPWSVMDALEVNRPRFVVVENVPEFCDWVFYRDWLRMIRRLGYKLTDQVLNSLAWGVPQDRSRRFVIGTLGPKPIRVRDPKGFKPTPMHDFVDWDGGEWMSFRSCPGEGARAQFRRADREFKGGPSFVSLVSHRPVWPSSEPLRTMTTQDQVRLVYKGKYRFATDAEAFAFMGFPSDYVLPECGRTIAWAMAGDAVCPPVMRGIVEVVKAAA